jgi:AcrR family transcriptional regulator
MAAKKSDALPARVDDADSTEERVHREAARLFRKQGFTKTSTRELANAVGLQSASLYHYMTTKEDLLSAICLRGYDLIIDAVREATNDVPGDQVLDRAIRANMATAIANRDVYLTTLAEVKSLSPRARREVDRKRREYTALLSDLIERAQRSGFLRDDIPAEHLLLILRNQLSWTIFWFKEDGELTVDDFASLAHKVLVEGAGR